MISILLYLLLQFNDPYYPQQWGFKAINADKATEDQIVRIAVLDTGVDANNIDIQTLPAHSVVGIDTQDYTGHGTGIISILSSKRNNGIGMAGILTKAEILPIKIFSDINQASDSLYTFSRGIDYAISQNVDIISASISTSQDFIQYPCRLSYLQQSIQKAIDNNILIIMSAGNDGLDTPNCPAAMDGIISIGAIGWNNQIWSKSNRGVDFVAPGTLIYVAGLDNNYHYRNGTSVAVPYATGVAAIILSNNPELTPGQVKQTMIDYAIDLGEPGYDEVYGYGLVSAIRMSRVYLPMVTK